MTFHRTAAVIMAAAFFQGRSCSRRANLSCVYARFSVRRRGGRSRALIPTARPIYEALSIPDKMLGEGALEGDMVNSVESSAAVGWADF